MKIVHLKDDVDLRIADGNLGIFVSGGADSAILLYLLMCNLDISQKLVIFSTHSNLKGRSSLPIVGNIIEYCINRTAFNNIYHFQQFVDEQNIQILYSPMAEFGSAFNIQQVFTGMTAAPPLEECEAFKGINTNLEKRNPNVIKNTSNGIYERPFINKNKKFIAELYSYYQVDALFSLSRSCEKFTSVPINYHCGQCWWCEERKWAFGRTE